MKKVVLLFLSFLFYSCLFSQQEKLLNDSVLSDEFPEVTFDEDNQKSYRVTFGTGYAYRMGKMEKTGDKQLDDFIKGLRHGFNLDFEIQTYINSSYGVSVNAHYIQQRNTGIANEKIEFVYFGPSLISKFESTNKKYGLYLGVGIKAVYFSDEVKASGWSINPGVSEFAFGTDLSIAGQTRISQKCGLGLKLSLYSSQKKIDAFDSDKKTNLSNFSVTAFFSYQSK